MNKLFLIIILFSTLNFLAQVPQAINYQGIARSNTGLVLQGQNITVKIKFFNDGIVSATSYEETHSVTTDNFGYFNLLIGTGTPIFGSFNAITWNTGAVNYELYLNGNLVGNKTPFASVPYALHSEANTNNIWGRTLVGTKDNVFLNNKTDYVNIGLPSSIGAQEKLHVHNSQGSSYISITTSNNTDNVGLVFGEASNWSKGVLSFDNNANDLVYRLFGKSTLLISGITRATLLGKLPIFANSTSMLNVYDSITTTFKPILKVMNNISGGTLPSSIFIGETTANNGLNLSYRNQGLFPTFSIDGPNGISQLHTFNANGQFFPGNDGAIGKSFIKGGNALNDDITIKSSANGVIVNDGFTQLGGNSSEFPELKVLAFTGTFPSSSPGTATISLGSFIPVINQIVSVQVLVIGTQYIISPGDASHIGHEYYYEFNAPLKEIHLSTVGTANSANLYGQPYRILITIKK